MGGVIQQKISHKKKPSQLSWLGFLYLTGTIEIFPPEADKTLSLIFIKGLITG